MAASSSPHVGLNMQSQPERWIQGPGQQQWRHGPIDLQIQVEGETEVVEAAIQQAWVEFQGVLEALVQELPVLRQAVQAGASNPLQGPIARAMWQACQPLAGHQDDEFITPMAAVAGAVAQHVLRHFERAGVQRAAINNGGDIALHLAKGAVWRIGVVSDANSVWLGAQLGQVIEPDAELVIEHDGPVRGIATSGWSGRSLSRGIADSVTVLAASAAQADAAATLIANRVDLAHPGIVRRPADQVRDHSDLGSRLVTCHVPALSLGEITTAMGRGLAYAQGLVEQGLVYAALITCQKHHVACGPQGRIGMATQGALSA